MRGSHRGCWHPVPGCWQNIQKYAHAEQVIVRVGDGEGHLCFDVDDDGAGFDLATTRRGAGLANMEDRLDALVERSPSPVSRAARPGFPVR
ncbi:MAG: hypothetical protein ABI352_02875 [Candidatus Dormibacter sp.]